VGLRGLLKFVVRLNAGERDSEGGRKRSPTGGSSSGGKDEKKRGGGPKFCPPGDGFRGPTRRGEKEVGGSYRGTTCP